MLLELEEVEVLVFEEVLPKFCCVIAGGVLGVLDVAETDDTTKLRARLEGAGGKDVVLTQPPSPRSAPQPMSALVDSLQLCPYLSATIGFESLALPWWRRAHCS